MCQGPTNIYIKYYPGGSPRTMTAAGYVRVPFCRYGSLIVRWLMLKRFILVVSLLLVARRRCSEVAPAVSNYRRRYRRARRRNNKETRSISDYRGSKFNIMYFSAECPFESIGYVDQETGNANVIEGVREQDRPYFGGVYAKCPYRNGIGTYLKILKDKLYYYFNPSYASHICFFAQKLKGLIVWYG